jgi:DNA-binding SARP family transcriptional activator
MSGSTKLSWRSEQRRGAGATGVTQDVGCLLLPASAWRSGTPRAPSRADRAGCGTHLAYVPGLGADRVQGGLHDLHQEADVRGLAARDDPRLEGADQQVHEQSGVRRGRQLPTRHGAIDGGLHQLEASGQQVTRAAWQSRRARDLLKLLVARRGRPVPRGVLMEALWPDEDPARVANRLSVALSTIRGVLDPDRRFATDEFIAGDNDTVALNLDTVEVDLERFLALAAEGLADVERGDVARGLPLLASAGAAYTGDFLEENPYDDWALPAREEARAAYIAVARALARHSGSDPDAVARHLLRILELDRYDEEAHLDLVRTLAGSGRHGEAHRHYLTYRRRMDDLGVEPVPFPAPSGRPQPTLRLPEDRRRTNGDRGHGAAVAAGNWGS